MKVSMTDLRKEPSAQELEETLEELLDDLNEQRQLLESKNAKYRIDYIFGSSIDECIANTHIICIVGMICSCFIEAIFLGFFDFYEFLEGSQGDIQLAIMFCLVLSSPFLIGIFLYRYGWIIPNDFSRFKKYRASINIQRLVRINQKNIDFDETDFENILHQEIRNTERKIKGIKITLGIE